MNDPTITSVERIRGTARIYRMSDGSLIERDGGTVAWRNNNPGNLKLEYAGDADTTHNVARTKAQALATAKEKYPGSVDLDQWGNIIFDSAAHGEAAKIKLIASKGEMTVHELVRAYSKADYSGSTHWDQQEATVYATAQAKGIELRQKKIGQMTQPELAALAEGMSVAEGVRKGTEKILEPARSQTLQPVPTAAAAPTPSPKAEQTLAATDGMQLHAAFDLGVKYDHNQYALNIKNSKYYHPGVDGKHPDQGYVDCSGWAATLTNTTMEEINRNAGREVFGKKDRMDLGNDGSGEIVQKAAAGSRLLEGKSQVFAAGALKEGMVIGIDSGKTSHDHWKGIDHIVVVVRDPKTGTLMASQSSPSRGGVDVMPLDKYVEQASKTGYHYYAADPLAKARGLLQDHAKTQTQTQTAPAATVAPARSGAATAHNNDGVINNKDRGAAVIDVQQMLNTLGYAGADGKRFQAKEGIYGPGTTHAVKQFQQAHGIAPSGAVDKQTLDALKVAAREPLLTSTRHPDNRLYEQIKERCDAQGGAQKLGLGNEREYRQALATMAFEAKTAGMTSVDHVVPSTNGRTLVVMQINQATGDQVRAVVDKQQAMQQPVEQSSYQLQQAQQQLQQAAQQSQQQPRPEHQNPPVQAR